MLFKPNNKEKKQPFTYQVAQISKGIHNAQGGCGARGGEGRRAVRGVGGEKREWEKERPRVREIETEGGGERWRE